MDRLIALIIKPLCWLSVAGLLAVISLPTSSAQEPGNEGGSPTIEAIKARGFLSCGVGDSGGAFSRQDASGRWVGFDADYCRALAAAVLGDAERVSFKASSSPQRFSALEAGEVDVLFRNTTVTLLRDLRPGLAFAGVTFYDGQGFLGRADHSIDGPSSGTVCVTEGSTSALNIAAYALNAKITLEEAPYSNANEAKRAFFSGDCDYLASDRSALLGALAGHAPDPNTYRLLDPVISREPLGPVTRDDDPVWFDLVRWTAWVPLLAENQGLSSRSALNPETSNPEARRLMGLHDNGADYFGLDRQWAWRIVGQVGAYDEIFRRNFGPETPYPMARGMNRLWKDGGLFYPPPFR